MSHSRVISVKCLVGNELELDHMLKVAKANRSLRYLKDRHHTILVLAQGPVPPSYPNISSTPKILVETRSIALYNSLTLSSSST